jgi:hypothetical protein
MNLIGQTIKTHDNKYIGKVVEQELAPVGVKARLGQGIQPNELYVAYAVRLEDGKPEEWSHVIARSDEDAFAKYVVA